MDPSATTASAASAFAKQYVFVDEYNRHKRLKVMRACDGCRKRKIKCDGALQNGPWPCGACSRLRLKCLPPQLDGDEDEDQQTSSVGASGHGQYSFQATTIGNGTGSKPKEPLSRPRGIQDWDATLMPSSTSLTTSFTPPTVPAQRQHDVDGGAFSAHSFSQQSGSRYDPGRRESEYFATSGGPPQYHQVTDFARPQSDLSSSPGGNPNEVSATVKELSEQMGELAIDTTSVAPWVANETRTLAETPAVGEVEVLLPLSVSTDSTVRIPPEMMPSNDRVMDYLGYFFKYVHPYVPVLNRAAFYDQWAGARQSISPLILEGVFACVARYLEKPIEARKWLALASRHEESFKDVPRLSTIQAMILLTKAREFVPRRGYYYRSWMDVRYMITMAIDLALDEHYDHHRSGDTCHLMMADCTVRTRIWQTLFSLEIMVGAPQGRTDFAIESSTVDFTMPVALADGDAYEYQTSRRLAYFAQNFRNIKRTNTLWQNLRRQTKDWALDPAFMQHNESIATWLEQLPPDLQMTYPEDDSAPYLGGDHFLAYLHCYHHLVVMMHHRPQLQALLEKRDSSFRVHLEICLQSAAMMCRIQEALLREFGLHGLAFMQRGLNFTIYCVLTCTMLHLAALTSPDPAFNSRARMYFTRHMRVLEQCISSASADIQVQINTLREAFSQDTSKPFELKPSLGLRSPGMENQPTPSDVQQSSTPIQATPAWPLLQDAMSSKTMSPTSEYGQPFDNIIGQRNSSQPAMPYHGTSFHLPVQANYTSQPLHRVTSTPQIGYALEPSISNEAPVTPVWDPSGIFSQWHSAFGGGGGSQGPQPPPQPQPQPQPLVTSQRIPPTSAPVMPLRYSPTAQQVMYNPQQIPTNAEPMLSETVPVMPTVTPVMWQNAFTTAYVSGHGNKRYRSEGLEQGAYGGYGKRRG